MNETNAELPPYLWGQETFHLRYAVPEDAAEIAAIKKLCWPGEIVRPARIAETLRSSTHRTILALQQGRVVGFVDGFATTGSGGLRWEVDLLAVEPGSRGKHLGEVLVRANYQHLQRDPHYNGVSVVRALIQVENYASQKTFERCGFTPGMCGCLYIGEGAGDAPGDTLGDADIQARLIPVDTMNYRGIWVEDSFSMDDFLAARVRAQSNSCDLAGAVIPSDLPQAFRHAEAAGYELVEEYQWWCKDLGTQ